MIRLLVVDRVRLVCEIIGAVLEGEPDIHVAGMATSRDEALAQLAAQKEQDGPGVNLVLINTSLPSHESLDLVREIRQMSADVRILVLGLPDTEAVIMRYIEAGAMGYVLATDSSAKLLHAVRAAFQSHALISPSIAATLMARIADLSQKLSCLGINHSDYETLTPREKEILDLIAEGATNQEIADHLIIELGTVKNHVHSILKKLNVHSRQDAATYVALLNGNNGSADPYLEEQRNGHIASRFLNGSYAASELRLS